MSREIFEFLAFFQTIHAYFFTSNHKSDITPKLPLAFMAFMFSKPSWNAYANLFVCFYANSILVAGLFYFHILFMCVPWILCWHALSWIYFDRSFTMDFFIVLSPPKKLLAKLFVYFVADLFHWGLAVFKLFARKNSSIKVECFNIDWWCQTTQEKILERGILLKCETDIWLNFLFNFCLESISE